LLTLTLALTLALGAAAFAQETIRVRGTITSLDGNVLSVQGATSVYKITISDTLRVQWIAKSDLANIGPHTYVGTVATPQADGTLRAVEVQIFPEAARGQGEGSRPWDSIPNSSMTNATVETIAPTTVDKVTGRTIVLTYKDGTKTVFVPENVPVVTYLPADRSALKPGAHIITSATKSPDGTIATASINVGKDGLVPPM
jgi:hypothetical protein